MRVLGVDYGRARVGVALGDSVTRIVTPWRVLERTDTEDMIERLRALSRQEGASLIVVGVPHPLGDRDRMTDQAKEILVFIEQLRAAGMTVAEEDETWTSKLAATQAAEMSQTKKRDDLAAAAILQSYLDRA